MENKSSSSIVTLYSLYFEVIPERNSGRLKQIVLLKMEHYADRVASLAEQVLQALDPSHIPISMYVSFLLTANSVYAVCC